MKGGARILTRPAARPAAFSAAYPSTGRGEWTPTPLFASGAAGGWYEPSPTTCYTDVAMTTLAGVGDTVAAMVDLSGNAKHATQANAAKQPKLRQDANGSYYLEVDGIDDYMEFVEMTLSGGMMVSVAAMYTSDSTQRLLVGHSVDDSKLGVVSSVVDYFFRAAPSDTALLVDVASHKNSTTIFTGRRDSSNNLVGYVNGSSVDSDTSGGADGKFDLLGAGNNSGVISYFMQGRIYGACISEGYSDGNRQKLEQYLAKLAGVTL